MIRAIQRGGGLLLAIVLAALSTVWLVAAHSAVTNTVTVGNFDSKKIPSEYSRFVFAISAEDTPNIQLKGISSDSDWVVQTDENGSVYYPRRNGAWVELANAGKYNGKSVDARFTVLSYGTGVFSWNPNAKSFYYGVTSPQRVHDANPANTSTKQNIKFRVDFKYSDGKALPSDFKGVVNFNDLDFWPGYDQAEYLNFGTNFDGVYLSNDSHMSNNAPDTWIGTQDLNDQFQPIDSTHQKQHSVAASFSGSSFDLTYGVNDAPVSDMSDWSGYFMRLPFTFEPPRYNITFGDTPNEPLDGTTGTTVKLPTPPSKPGYDFERWVICGTDTAVSDPYRIGDSDVEVCAKYVAKKATVTYDANGGTGSIPNISTQFDATVSSASSGFTKDGHTLTGWKLYDSKNAFVKDVKLGESFKVSDTSMKLKSVWTPVSSSVFFDSNGGTGVMNKLTGSFGETKTLPPTDFTKTGYHQTGWTVCGTDTRYDLNSPITFSKNDVTLCAVWEGNPSYLSFDPNGGVGLMKNVNGKVDERVTVPASSFTREGYTQTGWEVCGTSTKVALNGSYTLVSGGSSLCATWKPSPSTLTFVSNGGSGTIPPVVGVTDQTFGVPPSTFTRDGYTQTGWTICGTTTRVELGGSVTLPPNGLRLCAEWSPNPADITFNANGGSGSMNPLHSATDKTVSIPESKFTRNGYTQTGWEVCSSKHEVALKGSLKVPAGGVELCAVWVADNVDVTFNPNGGKGSMDPIHTVTDGSVDIPSSGFTRTGYTQTGWKVCGTSTSVDSTKRYKVPAGGAELCAVWTPNKSVISFDPNGGDGTMGDVISHTDEKVTVPVSGFTRDGYTQTGWKNCKTGEKFALNSSFTAPAGGVRLCADWKANPSKIAYDANGGSGTVADTVGVTDEVVKVASNSFTREGYSFVGWSPKADGEASVNPGSNFTLPAGGTTLYAVWSADPSSVVFNANGGSGEMTALTGVTDQVVNVPESSFTRDGYTFTGWKVCEKDVAVEVGSELTLPAGGVELCAQWKADPSELTFVANGGTGSMDPVIGVTDEEVTVPDSGFTRDGYTQVGWKVCTVDTDDDSEKDSYIVDESSDMIHDGDAYTLPADGVSLCAQWEANESSIIFDSNGGTGSMDPVVGKTDDKVTIPETGFTRDGFKQTGWAVCGSDTRYDLNSEFVLPPNGTKLCAVWEEVPVEPTAQAPDQPTSVMEKLAATGSSVGGVTAVAALLTAAGVAFVVVARRKRRN